MSSTQDFQITKGVLVKYKGAGGDVIIPVGVTKVGNSAFYGCTSLISVTIPVGVTTIGNSAFHSCTGLISINVTPGNKTYSDVDGVIYDKERTELVFCPDGVTNITIPDGLAKISPFAFSAYTKLPQVLTAVPKTTEGSYTVSDLVKYIEVSAFQECKKITNIVIPNGVRFIGENAFDGCKKLSKITVDGDNQKYASIDGVLYSKDLSAIIKCPAARTGDFILPDGVTVIAGQVFSGCIGLTGITIPVSVSQISDKAFQGIKNATFYLDINSFAFDYAVKDKYCKSNVIKITNTAETINAGSVNKNLIDHYLENDDAGMLLTLLPHFRNLDKYIDDYISKAQKRKQTKLTVFLVDWKSKNVDSDKEAARKERAEIRSLSGNLTAAEFRKLFVLRENPDKTLTICEYKGQASVVVIPEKIGTKKVVCISAQKLMEYRYGIFEWRGGYHPFSRDAIIKHITIPGSVTKFEDGAFSDCKNLTIHAPVGSRAEEYAKEHSIRFAAIE